MSIKIGVIGAGVMGADHVRTITREVPRACVALICDALEERARAAAEHAPGARITHDPLALISAPDIAAVVVASPDETHAQYVLACIAAGKPVLCEKPLAPTLRECLPVIEAEQRLGRRLVQTGYMRRFDPAYLEMKLRLDAGDLGEALLLHCIHRNAVAPSFFRSQMSVTNAAVHEFDIARWLFGAELTCVQVFKCGRSRPDGVHDPILLVLATDKGQLVEIEIFMNAGYGYDVRAEAVCERGTVSMPPPVLAEVNRSGSQSHPYARDWRPRFAAAYAGQMRAWVESIENGRPAGASAWDGLVATAVAEAGVRALETGSCVSITLPKAPSLYC